jgi:hypothetical protein
MTNAWILGAWLTKKLSDHWFIIDLVFRDAL